MLATLYNPSLPPAPGTPVEAQGDTPVEATWFTTAPKTFLGTQALLVRPADAARALAAWDTAPGMQSARLARILTAGGGTICVHRPSLVQHRAADSAWGALLHTAPDFAGG